MGHVFCDVSAQLAVELEVATKKEYEYFGHVHLDAETGHAIGIPEAEYLFAEIELTESQRQEVVNAVEATFKIFTEWTYELLAYAQNHPIQIGVGEEVKALEMACV
jgi:hypothetical protein